MSMLDDNTLCAPATGLALSNCQDALGEALRHLQAVLQAPTPQQQYAANAEAQAWLESIGAL